MSAQVIGYAGCSTDEQGLNAQRDRLRGLVWTPQPDWAARSGSGPGNPAGLLASGG